MRTVTFAEGARCIAAAVFALALLPSPAISQPSGGQVTVKIEPEEWKLEPGKTHQVEVTIRVDVPTTPAPPPGSRAMPGQVRDPRFSVGATSGSFAPDPASPLKPVADYPTYFDVPRAEGANRATGEARYIYTTAPNAAPGEVIITVQGGQGISLMGMREQNLPTFRGSARLILTGGPGSARPGEQGLRPPFEPTDATVNPLPNLVGRATAIAGLLGTIALVNWGVTRTRARPADRKPKEKPPAKQPPEPTPPKKEERIEAPKAGCELVVLKDSGPQRGNGTDEIHFQVSAIPSQEATVRFLGPVRWQPRILAPGRSRPNASGEYQAGDFDAGVYAHLVDDPDPPSFTNIAAENVAHQHWKLRLPWEWRDVSVEFTVTATAQLTTTANGQEKVLPPATVTASSKPIRIAGANPALAVSVEPGIVDATGRDRAELLASDFRLFGAPAPRGEKVWPLRIEVKSEATGSDSGKKLTGPEWTHLVSENDKTHWVPPFLLQEPGYGELMQLAVGYVWTDGEMYALAAQGSSQPLPLPPASCEATLRGCNVDSRLEGQQFIPLPDTKLTARVRLLSASAKGVNNPLADDAIHSKQARITARVRDLSQGRPTRPEPHRCKLPPQHPCDVDLPAGTSPESTRALRAKKLEEILADPLKGREITPPTIAVKDDGYLFATQHPEIRSPVEPTAAVILFWNYIPRADEEPIHDAPVVYNLTLEDGLGGTLELRDAWHAQLGSLLLETGGLDFRVYEYRPFCFDVACDDPLPPGVQKTRFCWEFAIVDREGNPVRAAGARETEGRVESRGALDPLSAGFAPLGTPVQNNYARSDLVVGHMPAQRDIYINIRKGVGAGGAKEGEVQSFPPGRIAAPEHAQRERDGWRRIEKGDREHSVRLRHEWHTAWRALSDHDRATVSEEEAGLPWLEKKDPVLWRDQTLFLSVRVELRDEKNHLLATSDRLAPWGLAAAAADAAGGVSGAGGRTPSEYVWRDHMFRFVLLALRLRLQDDTGERYIERPYKLELGDPSSPQEATGTQGQIERVLAPLAPDRELEEGTLVLLTPDGKPKGAEFKLRLGELDPVAEQTGWQARLNNLGLFATRVVSGAQLTGDSGEQLKRGVQRFQTLRHLEPSGTIDDRTARDLEEVHDEIGIVQDPNLARSPTVTPQAPAGDAVPCQRRDPPLDDPLKPGPLENLRKREACVGLGLPNTLRIPGDPRRESVRADPDKKEADRWFTSGGHPAMTPRRSGNEVRYLIDGPETFRQMVEVMGQASGTDDYIYILGWCLYPYFELIPGDTKSTLYEIFKAAAGSFEAAWAEWNAALTAADRADAAAERAAAGACDKAAAAALEALEAAERATVAAARAGIASAVAGAQRAAQRARQAAEDAATARRTLGRSWTPGYLEEAAAEAAQTAADAARTAARAAASATQSAARPGDPIAAQKSAEAQTAARAAAASAQYAGERANYGFGDEAGTQAAIAASQAERAAVAGAYAAIAEPAAAARKAAQAARLGAGASAAQKGRAAEDAAKAARDLARAASDAVARIGATAGDPAAAPKASEAQAAAQAASAAADRAAKATPDPGAADAAAAARAAREAVEALRPAIEALEIAAPVGAATRLEADAAKAARRGNTDPLGAPDYVRQLEVEHAAAVAERARAATSIEPAFAKAKAAAQRALQAAERAAAQAKGTDAATAAKESRVVAEAIPRTLTSTQGRQVQVRALLWQHTVPDDPLVRQTPLPVGYQSPGGQQSVVVARINQFTHGGAFQENITEGPTGSHHQKVLVVQHGGKLTAFCGGLDINPDRMYPLVPGSPNEKGDTEGPPFHDVHCRIDGPAAYDLLQVFVHRWDHLPEHWKLGQPELRGSKTLQQKQSGSGSHFVQIGRTFGIPNVGDPIVGLPQTSAYKFAPRGERTVWRMIRHAIRQAERFIYLEDQYLTSEATSKLLFETLTDRRSIEHVTILFPRDAHAVMYDWQGPLRRRFLKPLLDAFPEKVRVFTLTQPAVQGKPVDWHTYIHTKMWIIDDRFAIIGTANCNRRSYTNDSEVQAGIFDESSDEYCAYHTAHQLRIALWAEHLNMDTPEGHAELADGVASAVHWLRPPPGARVAAYPLSTQAEPTSSLKNEARADPLGSGDDPPE